jgi:hypothetical protein
MAMAVGVLFHLDQHDRAEVVRRLIRHTVTHYVELDHQMTLDAMRARRPSLTCVLCHGEDTKKWEARRGRGTGLKYIQSK